VPICQSPRISEVLLRAKTAAANENDAAVTKSLKSFESRSTFKADWSRLVRFLWSSPRRRLPNARQTSSNGIGETDT
jgi:hypothetical protein